MTWPLVVTNDDGIRPAGAPDACFYCAKKVGAHHAQDCVVVTKTLRLKADIEVFGAFEWDEKVPFYWDDARVIFRYNLGTWCAGNVMRKMSHAQLDALETAHPGNTCLCDVAKVGIVGVVDAGPNRKVKSGV